jgi:hypothetical protein
MDDLDAQVKAVLADHERREAKRKTLDVDMGQVVVKAMDNAIAKVARAEALERGDVQIVSFEC